MAILFWFCGCVYALAGAHVYIEYGLNVPRYVIDGIEQSIPRSGGDLHYLQYVFSWPRYRAGTVLFSGVLFGISFIAVGNMAGNCLNCALRILQAANPGSKEPFDNDTVRGLAVVIAIFPCLIHTISRRGGILLNNALAITKVLMLVFIIVATWVVAGGWNGLRDIQNRVEDAEEPESASSTSDYVHAFLSISESFALNFFESYFTNYDYRSFCVFGLRSTKLRESGRPV